MLSFAPTVNLLWAQGLWRKLANGSNGLQSAGCFGRGCSIESELEQVLVLRLVCDLADCGTIDHRRGELIALEIVDFPDTEVACACAAHVTEFNGGDGQREVGIPRAMRG